MNTKNSQNDKEKILEYIQAHGTVDKDKIDSPRKSPQKICRKHMVRLVLDLHGMKSDEAVRRIRNFLSQCVRKGIKEILIIHGRGIHSNSDEGPVLKNLVKDMLEHELSNYVRDYRTALPRDGGEGASLVYLK